MRRYFLIVGALVLMLAMVAACGDDDDDGDTDVTDDVTVTMPDTDDDATEDDADVTATSDNGEATGTEADADMTGTESDGAAGTMDADATGTDDDDADATGTEDDDADDGTETDDDDASATEDDDMDDATGTEDDDADDADATGTDDDSADATAGDDDAGFGEPVIIGDFILTVNDVMELDSGGVVAPDEGNKFLGVELTVENTGSDAIGLSQALLMTRLEDDDGEQYEVDLAATAIAIFSGGFDPATEIGPGSEITGVAGFQVPEDLSPDDLTLVIEPEAGEHFEIPLGDDDDTP